MRYELTLTFEVKTPVDQDRVVQQLSSLFEFGVLRESIADGLHLLDDPRLINISARKGSKPRRL